MSFGGTGYPIGDYPPPSSGKEAGGGGNSYMGMGAAAIGLIGDYFSGRKASNERKRAEQRMLDMDNTKHQREVRDLRKAGLNPILSSTQGAASAGQVPGPAPVPQYGESIRGGISSALQMAMLKANLDNVNADTAAKTASALLTGKTASNVPPSGMALERYDKETKEVQQRIWKLDTDIAIGNIDAERARLEYEWLKRNKDKLVAIMAPVAYEREQIDRLFSGDFSPSTVVKLFLEMWKSR